MRPTMSAGVMQAKVIWKAMKTSSGIVPASEAGVTPLRKLLDNPPQNRLSEPPKDME